MHCVNISYGGNMLINEKDKLTSAQVNLVIASLGAIVLLMLVGSVTYADLDRLVINNGQLQQVQAPQTIYNHPDVDIYHQNGTSDHIQGNMIYHSNGSVDRIETNGNNEISVFTLGE